MLPLSFSSGDPIADRRADFAEGLFEAGDREAAADLLADALTLVPGWAAGWYRLGEYRLAAGQADRAVEAWQSALRCDPTDRLGAGLQIDLARPTPVAETMPAAFVETLFDQYATRFESSLVGQLQYRGPEQIVAALDAAGTRGFARALDLGCGTGLMGVALRSRCSALEGCDLSAEMLREAEGKGVYDRLEKRDIQALELLSAPVYDLVVAADVFIYLGALERVFGWVPAALRPGGAFAFSVELNEGPEEFLLRDSRRYAHSAAYVRGLLESAGLTCGALRREVLRFDRGAPVAALIVVAVAPGRTVDRTGEAMEAA